MVQVLKNKSELEMQRAENKFSNNLNATDMFYLSMSRTIQKLPELDQVRIRMELCKLVSDTEICQIQAQAQTNTKCTFDTTNYGQI